MTYKTYILHKAGGDETIKGDLHEYLDSVTGKLYLRGTLILNEVGYKDRAGDLHIDRTVCKYKVDISGISYTEVPN